MRRRAKVRKTRRLFPQAQPIRRPKRQVLFEILEERVVFSTTTNPIIAENELPGTPQSVWDVDGSGSANIQGFAAEFSIDHGQTEQFKVDTDASAYHLDIYRMGYYGGDGARYITTVYPSAALPQDQPDPITDLDTGLVDCGNWAVSASWAIPSTAVSGVYIAKLVRDDGTFGESQIIFVVRADESTSDIVFKTADSTWEAYNDYDGSSLYGANFLPAGRSYEVSYNRPFETRDRISANFYFGEELAMTEFLEENGYDVTYVASMDLDRDPGLLLNHKVFMSVGHDEYWSAAERDAVLAAGNAGVNISFFSGNEMFWKTYWAPSADPSATPYTTLVCYKETFDNAITDPENPDVWTGTWRDPRFTSVTDGNTPENSLTGQLFEVNGDGTVGLSINVPASDASLRFWRNTSIASLTGNQVATIGEDVLGYEWDSDVDNGFRPAGLIDMSSTTANVSALIQDYGSTFAPGTATNSFTMYRMSSGALVFGAGTIQYSWGLSSAHDGPATTPDKNMQQATINLFADMGVQPGTLMPGMVPATMSTDHTPPTSVITSPIGGVTLQVGVPVTVTGTAKDSGGGVVAGVEVSVDGGLTWHPATGRSSWSYTFTPHSTGQFTIISRATDDSANIEIPTSKVTVNPNLNPGVYSLWAANATPASIDGGDGQSVTVGLQFKSDVDGFITGIKFYKASDNTGTHIANLWNSNGQLLATATFTSETSSGWQQVNFATPVQVKAGAVYTASYYAPNGHYSVDRNYFAPIGVDNGPLHAVPLGSSGTNGVYVYGGNQFPTQSYQSTNYWVDVVLNTQMTLDTTPPVVQSVDVVGAATLTTDSSLVVKFSEALNPASINSNSVELVNPSSTMLPSGCCGTPSGWCSGCPLQMGTATTVVTATLSYDPVADTVTITPNAPLATSSIYTVLINGGANGVTDLAGNPLANDTARSFITPAQPATVVSTVWPSTATPAIVDSGDNQGTELGMKFVATANGTISGIRFYKSDANTGTHTGSLWSASGQLLATGTFTNETASGWQQLNFATPVAITAGTTYVASYHTTSGHYSVTRSSFTSPLTSGLIQVPANGGVFFYGTGSVPTQTYQSSNYWVDVVLHTAPPTDMTPPTVMAFSPSAATASVATSAAATITFSEGIDPSTISVTTVKLLDSGNNVVPATLTYDTAAHTVTITPSAPLANSMTYTIFAMGGIAGVKDGAGNPLAQSVGSTFSTIAAVGPDTTPPTVLAYSPANGATTVPINGTMKVTFSEAMNAATISSSTVLLLKNGVNRVTETVTYDPTTHSATITPSSPLLNSTSYTIYVVGGVTGIKDLAGNQLVDVSSVFTTAAPDTTPPTVTTITPANGTGSVDPGATISVGFSELVNPATVNVNTITLVTGTNVAIPGTVTYNAASNTATFTPANPLSSGATYTVVVKGGATGVTDLAGNALVANVSSVFGTNAVLSSGGGTSSPSVSTLWSGTTTPTTVDSGDTQAVELGVKFTATSNGTIIGIRYYKSAANTGTHTGSLWSSTGTLLATATFTGEGGSGWQQVLFSTPVSVAAGTTYVAGYHTTTGHYAVNRSYFSSPFTSGSLQVPANGGVYSYGAGSFPTQSYQGSNYWIDVLFGTTPVDTTPPTVIGFSPTNGTANVATSGAVSITFSEALNAATVTAASVSLRDANNAVVPTTLSYTSGSQIATLMPSSPLSTGKTYTIVVLGGAMGIEDVAGNALATTATSVFATAAADTTPPTVTAFSPATGTSNVATNASITISFSEVLSAATVNSTTITLKSSSNVAVAAVVTYNASNNTATLTPTSALANGTGYTISVLGGASGVKDVAGNALASTATSSFTTTVGDITPPTVTGFSPAGNATNVATNSSITVTFSEALNAATVSASTITLKNSSNVTVPATVTYNAANNTATLTPTSALANGTGYTISVLGGASGVKDVAGNALASTATSSFTTVAASVTYNLFSSTATPTTVDSGDTQSVELGVKFTASTSGYITGIRYYKSSANTGTHTGSLWSSTGTLLATATFTGEGGSGWQQVLFSTPVAVTAGTTYVASYHTTSGHYAVNRSYFASSVTSGPLQVPASGGVYLYGAGGFPTQSFQASNYWVDVVFSTTPPAPDTTPPTVTAFNPANGATNVATSAPLTVSFSEALNAATITSSTVTLRNSSNVTIPATVTYNTATNTATLTPTSPLSYATTYTITVTGGTSGVKDVAGNALTANVTSSFATASQPASSSLFAASATPATIDSGDTQAVELGVKFTASSNGYITGVRFYKSAANTGTHTGSLWSSSGVLLATATFTSEGASGWQQVNFATPIAVTAGTTYVASYHTAVGHYSVSRSYFTSPVTTGPLQALANGGVYMYGAGGFPTQTYQSSNYWVDVVFTPS
jgi:methionine-rich copper-binding protein CopC